MGGEVALHTRARIEITARSITSSGVPVALHTRARIEIFSMSLLCSDFNGRPPHEGED